jgi:hypothetical protein
MILGIVGSVEAIAAHVSVGVRDGKEALFQKGTTVDGRSCSLAGTSMLNNPQEQELKMKS